jgi:hypothetical protein
MSAPALTIRVTARLDRDVFPRDAALLVACAALDAIATGILLLGPPLPLSLGGLAAAISHGTAVLLFSGFARTRPSRRWLCGAAMLAVPFVGAAVATAAFLSRGRGSFARERRRARPRPALTTAALQRLGDALSPCDALGSGDEEQRRAALSALSRREDSEAIALLRRAASGRDPDLALSAALVLDEIGKVAERNADRPDPAEVRLHVG